jgi:hypothetical protein
MSLEKKIKFDEGIIKLSDGNYKNPIIKFNNPLLIKEFTIRSKELIYYNIFINGHYLIYFQDYDREYNDYEEYDNCIISEYNDLDGYHNHYKFNNNIYIESIEIENKHPEFEDLPHIYFEYDNDYLENDKSILEYEYMDSYCFMKKYFKFLYVNDDIELIKIFNIQVEYKDKKRSFIEKPIDESTYKFKHYKKNTYYVEFDEEQFKKMDYYYKFNNMNFFSSYYPII